MLLQKKLLQMQLKRYSIACIAGLLSISRGLELLGLMYSPSVIWEIIKCKGLCLLTSYLQVDEFGSGVQDKELALSDLDIRKADVEPKLNDMGKFQKIFIAWNFLNCKRSLPR